MAIKNNKPMKEIIALTPNTGGPVSSENTIGRDAEIEEFWKILRTQSIALFAERRFGKSSILRKMEADGNDDFITIYKPVEGISVTEDFAAALIERVKEKGLIDEGITKKLESFYNKATDVIEEAGGVKIKKLQYVWQEQLVYLFKKLSEKHKDKVIVLMLDEFSIFLSKLKNEDAANVIGFLRDVSYDKQFDMIRFVYCGSIGIDLVLDKIKKEINIGEPLNHMYKYELEPFTKGNALYFCKCLRLGCDINVSDDLLENICKRTDNIPFFIDIVFDKLGECEECNIQDIDAAFEEILDDTKGRDSIKHFCDRIDNFYPNSDISNYILNFISKNSNPSSENEIADFITLSIKDVNRIMINTEIERLRNDGYLTRYFRDKQRQFDFKYSLLKLWWERNKAL